MGEQSRTYPGNSRPAGRGPAGGPPPGRGPMGHMGMGMSGEKPRHFKQTLRTFLTYLKPFRISILIALSLSIVSTAFAIIGPKLMGNATTKLFEGIVAKVTNVPGAAIDFEYIGNIIMSVKMKFKT